MPVICAVATDEPLRAALERVLRHRFGADYDVVVADGCEDARQQLSDAACEPVALVVAQMRMTDGDGIPLLVETTGCTRTPAACSS
jgi:DNA-binding NtrC family response regulator